MLTIKTLSYKIILVVVFIILSTTLVGCRPETKSSQQQQNENSISINTTQNTSRKFKILHIMSFHSDWEWTETQLGGFKDALKDLNIEYRVFEMDAKNHSSEQWKKEKGKEARELIENWQPDLVYANDDPAQEYVTQHYLNSEIPFVFSGVNSKPEKYGFKESTNVTGVLEKEHFVQSAKLLKKIAPDVKKVAVVIDDSPMWEPVIERIKSQLDRLQKLEFVIWDKILTFAEYKQKIKEYQTKVDAIALIGIFNFKNEEGKNVHYRKVLKWTAENSQLPDFSLWMDRVSYGTLCVVSVSGYEQGLAAGKIARSIILADKSPDNIPMKPTTKGRPLISLARAKKLNIKINSKTLLSSQVIKKFAWEK